MKNLLSLFALLIAFSAQAQPKYVGRFFGDGLGLTNIPNGAIRSPWTNGLTVTGNVVLQGTAIGNGSGLTNLTLVIPTNVINTGVIPVGKTTYTNVTANIVIAGFSGVDLNYENWAEIYVTNVSGPSTPRSVTFAASVGPSTNTFVLDRAFWVTNDMDIVVKIRAWRTNAAAVRWSP